MVSWAKALELFGRESFLGLLGLLAAWGDKVGTGRVVEDEQDFRDEVGTTFLHELGHYLGWDEDEVSERGLE